MKYTGVTRKWGETIVTWIFHHSQVSDVKSLALHVTSINLVSLERGSIVEYVFPCFQLGKLDLDVT